MLAQGDQGSRVRGPIASLNSLVGASPAKSRQLLPQLSIPRVARLSLSPQSSQFRFPNFHQRYISKVKEFHNQSPRAGRVGKPTNPNQSQSHDACAIVSFATFVASAPSNRTVTGARVAGRANRASGFLSPTRYILVTAKSASDYLRANIR